MKLLSVVGARPQFIKAATLSRALRRHWDEVLVHTGQHYDDLMSDVFFRELDMPVPDTNLGVGSASHAVQTARMLEGLEAAYERAQPDLVIVYGDTNSTLAGALAAAKLGLPVAHVEAGFRTHKSGLPEEINRVVADHVAAYHFCVTSAAAANLHGEGITARVHLTGDLMYDSLLAALPRARAIEATVLQHYSLLSSRKDPLPPGREGHGAPASSVSPSPISERGPVGEVGPAGEVSPYYLATVHRAATTDNPEALGRVLDAFGWLDLPIVLPLHPRTAAAIRAARLPIPPNLRIIDPVGYFEMLALERHARAILTDSGGVRREAYWLAVPCVTLRTESEWLETVETGWDVLAGTDPQSIIAAARRPRPATPPPPLFGDGNAAAKIVEVLHHDPPNRGS